MFPNVRLLIAAVVASVVALSCGFAVFAVFRVNHEPLSRLAAGSAPLQLAAGNPRPPAAIPAPADSFRNRFPSNNGDTAGASAQVTPPQPEPDDSVEEPSAVATTATVTTTAPETEPAEPAQPAPVALAPIAEPVAQIPEPDSKPNEVAATTPGEPAAPIEAPPATTDTAATAPIEVPAAATDTAATEPPTEQPAPAAQTAPTEQATQESNTPAHTHTATSTTAEPPPPEAPHKKAAHRHRLAAKAQHARQARAIAPTVSQPAGIGGPFVPPPSRLVAMPPPPRHARATVQPVSQPSGVGGPFVPPANR
jgi:hypothetical protein